MTKQEEVDESISARAKPVAAVLEDLRKLIKATEGIKWGSSVFFNAQGEPVIYLYGGRDHANLGFLRGADLADPEGFLEGTGKSGRHVKVCQDKPMNKKVIRALIRQRA